MVNKWVFYCITLGRFFWKQNVPCNISTFNKLFLEIVILCVSFNTTHCHMKS